MEICHIFYILECLLYLRIFFTLLYEPSHGKIFYTHPPNDTEVDKLSGAQLKHHGELHPDCFGTDNDHYNQNYKHMKAINYMLIFLSVFLLSCKSTMDIQVAVYEINNADVKVVKIGNQEWFAENLNVDHFSNGDVIVHAKTVSEWVKAGENGVPAWCYFNNDESIGKTHGKLYNWYAVSDERGLAPKGWQIPDDGDWNRLFSAIGNKNTVGHKMKDAQGWLFEGNGSNVSGLSVLPSGGRDTQGAFSSFGSSAFFWSMSDYLMFYGRYVGLQHKIKTVEHKNIDKNYGFSVRCFRKKVDM